jgi:hypothetical protein
MSGGGSPGGSLSRCGGCGRALAELNRLEHLHGSEMLLRLTSSGAQGEGERSLGIGTELRIEVTSNAGKDLAFLSRHDAA